MSREFLWKPKDYDDDVDDFPSPMLGIVAANDDPLHQNRIKAIIPAINERDPFDVWIRRLNLFVGSPGYGDFHPPELKTEVAIWAVMGQPYQFIYAPIYNEKFPVPPDFQDPATRGVRSDGDYKIITRGDLILEGGRVLIKSAFGTTQISAGAGLIIDPEDEGGGGEG
ncbi:MAG TPA: phage baseplate assembly protein V [Nitrososphaera sp.]|nr:phage baseplate assembly protein V [Nitrososphaera sp.]